MRCLRLSLGLLRAAIVPLLLWGANLHAQGVIVAPAPAPIVSPIPVIGTPVIGSPTANPVPLPWAPKIPCPPSVSVPVPCPSGSTLPPGAFPCPPGGIVGGTSTRPVGCPPCPVCPTVVPNPPAPADSRKVHFVILGDTNDANLGESIRIDNEKVLALRGLLAPEFRGEEMIIDGNNLTETEVFKRLDGLRVGENETLFVFCNLHGQKNDAAQELKLRGGVIDRKKLLAKLTERTPKPKLAVLITNACFQDPENATLERNRQGGIAPQVEENIKTPDAGDLFTELMVNHHGVVDINGCEPDQLAWSTVFTKTLATMTRNLRTARYLPVPEQGLWPTYFAQLKTETEDTFEQLKLKADEHLDKGTLSPRDHKKLTGQAKQTPHWFRDTGKDLPDFPKYLAEGRKIKAAEDKPGEPTPLPPGPEKLPEGKLPEGEAAAAPAQAQAATLRVELPAGAELYIDGARMPQNRGLMMYQTLKLQPGATQTLQVRAELQQGDKKLVERKDVTLRAGQEERLKLEFTEPIARPEAPPTVAPAGGR